jgi:DNA gyrase subunit A
LGEVGRIVDARVVSEKDEITLISAEGMVLRTTVENISSMGRATKGVAIMNLRKGDTVASLARINKGRKKRRK